MYGESFVTRPSYNRENVDHESRQVQPIFRIFDAENLSKRPFRFPFTIFYLLESLNSFMEK